MLEEKIVKERLKLCNPSITGQLCAALQMSPEESEVISKNYYLDHTEGQIADEIAVSRATVQRIKKRALQKIVHATRCLDHFDAKTTRLIQDIFFN